MLAILSGVNLFIPSWVGRVTERRVDDGRGVRTCAMSIHFSMTRARWDVNDDAVADVTDDDDGGVSPTTDAMTRCVTALNWSTVADTDATVSSEQPPVDD